MRHSEKNNNDKNHDVKKSMKYTLYYSYLCSNHKNGQTIDDKTFYVKFTYLHFCNDWT